MQVAGTFYEPFVSTVVTVQGVYDFKGNLLQRAVAHPIFQRGVIYIWFAGRPGDISHGGLPVFVHRNGYALKISVERVPQRLKILDNVVQRIGAGVIGAEGHLEHRF